MCKEEKVHEKKSRIPIRIPQRNQQDNAQMVLVAYQLANKRGHNLVSKKREKWTKLVAALNAKRSSMNSENEDEDNSSLDKWESVSTENLNNNSVEHSKPQNNDLMSCAVKEDIDNKALKLPLFKSNTKAVISSHSFCLNKPSNNSMNLVSDHGKYEFAKYKMETILSPNERNVNKSEVIDLSNDENENIKETNPNETKAILANHISRAKLKRPKDNNLNIVRAMQNVATAAQTTSELLARISKSTQKSETIQQLEEVPLPIRATGTISKNIPAMPHSTPVKLQQNRIIKVLKDTTTKVSPPQMPDSEIPSLKQRNMELHRLRVLVERKRLQLLDIKLQREHEDMARDRILFQRELKLSNGNIRHSYEEKDI